MTKKGQKWPKDRVWGLFKKIILLLSGICVNESSYGSEHSLQKLHAWEKSGSQVIASEISVFFNCQYFTNR